MSPATPTGRDGDEIVTGYTGKLSSKQAEKFTEYYSKPDGAEEHLFVLLAETDAPLADSLTRRFVEQWLPAAGLAPQHEEEALGTVELRVAPDERPGLQRLRLTSFFTGSTYWLYEWDGSTEAAEAFIDDTADLQASNVRSEREKFGSTEWD